MGICVPCPRPQSVFDVPHPQFVTDGASPQFFFTGPDPHLYLQTPSHESVFIGPGELEQVIRKIDCLKCDYFRFYCLVPLNDNCR